MLEAQAQVLKKEMGSVSVPILETATDPAGSSRLAEIEPRRVKVFETDETIHYKAEKKYNLCQRLRENPSQIRNRAVII